MAKPNSKNGSDTLAFPMGLKRKTELREVRADLEDVVAKESKPFLCSYMTHGWSFMVSWTPHRGFLVPD